VPLFGVTARRSTSSLEPSLMSSDPFRFEGHPWYFWPAVIVLIEVAWFALLYPLVPSSWRAFLIEVVLPVPVVGYAIVASRWIALLSDPSRRSYWRQGLAVAIAVSLGIGIFGSAYWSRNYLTDLYTYSVHRQ